ncbi:hypothetical protein INT45_005938 [Circinella minor]|uniref:Uncharacterized protein n=1 Tax=Circinella minor TaxID=1195481 RepID=A0A8H7VKN3_9FUNG|nr:hypothetical protein INT45_005938 [Circinella minor]
MYQNDCTSTTSFKSHNNSDNYEYYVYDESAGNENKDDDDEDDIDEEQSFNADKGQTVKTSMKNKSSKTLAKKSLLYQEPLLIRQTPEDERDHLLKEIHGNGSLPHDPNKDHLKTWFSLTLANSASIFLCDNTGIGRIGEADATYSNWVFISTKFHSSNIKAHGKELGSKANSFAQNSKRKLSGLEEAENAKGGGRMDTVYKCGEVEYGAMEIGKGADSTKELNDSRLKLPIVLKDMFLKLYDYVPELQREKQSLYYYSLFTRAVTVQETESSLPNFDKTLEPSLSNSFFPPCFTVKSLKTQASSESPSKRTSPSSSISTNQESSSSSS